MRPRARKAHARGHALRGVRRDEVRVWWLDLDAAAGLPEDALDVEERARAARLRSPEEATRFRRARAATRALLARHLDADAAALTFDRTCQRCGAQHGKPRLRDARGLRFNASRAGPVLAVAVAWDREVGVDVELRERARDVDLVAGASFAPGERASLAGLEGPARADAFLRAWTRKEAYLKLRGIGLAAPLARVDTSAWTDGEPIPDPFEPEATSFTVCGLPLRAGVVAALAAEGHGGRVAVHEWSS